MKKQVVVHVISNIYDSPEFRWLARYLKDDFSIHFIILNRENGEYSGVYNTPVHHESDEKGIIPTPHSFPLLDFLKENSIGSTLFNYNSKVQLAALIPRIALILRKLSPAIVHTHLWEGSILGLISSAIALIKTRIMTRHHSNYNHVYHPSAVKWDKLCNKLSTHIIATSSVVRRVLLQEGVSPEKITVIPHGIDFSEIHTTPERLKSFKHRYGIEGKSPIIGVVSRLEHWKGVHITIEGFKLILNEFPLALLLIVGARGPYYSRIVRMLAELPPTAYRLIPFEKDIWSAYASMDVLVHNPVDEVSEAFGQVYIEAMAMGVPMVCTVSGIAHELVRHEHNALVIPYNDAVATAASIKKILTDTTLASKLVENARKNIKKYSIENKISALKKLYQKFIF